MLILKYPKNNLVRCWKCGYFVNGFVLFLGKWLLFFYNSVNNTNHMVSDLILILFEQALFVVLNLIQVWFHIWCQIVIYVTFNVNLERHLSWFCAGVRHSKAFTYRQFFGHCEYDRQLWWSQWNSYVYSDSSIQDELKTS